MGLLSHFIAHINIYIGNVIPKKCFALFRLAIPQGLKMTMFFCIAKYCRIMSHFDKLMSCSRLVFWRMTSLNLAQLYRHFGPFNMDKYQNTRCYRQKDCNIEVKSIFWLQGTSAIQLQTFNTWCSLGVPRPALCHSNPIFLWTKMDLKEKANRSLVEWRGKDILEKDCMGAV
jgi:hypothetical protein